MATIVIPKRPQLWNRPGGVPQINRDSPQAAGLQLWITASTGGLNSAAISSGNLSDRSLRQWPSAFQNNGTCFFFSFPFGGAGANWNGSTERLEIPNFLPPKNITVAAWVRGPVGAPSWSNIIEGSRSAGGAFGMWKSGNGNFWHWRWSETSANDFGAWVPGNVTYLVGTNDGVTAKAYQDGRLVFSTASARTTPTSAVCTVGQSGAGEPFANDGQIADVRVYNYAWNQSQVTDGYNGRTRWDLYWVPKTYITFDTAVASSFLPRLAVLGAG